MTFLPFPLDEITIGATVFFSFPFCFLVFFVFLNSIHRRKRERRKKKLRKEEGSSTNCIEFKPIPIDSFSIIRLLLAAIGKGAWIKGGTDFQNSEVQQGCKRSDGGQQRKRKFERLRLV